MDNFLSPIHSRLPRRSWPAPASPSRLVVAPAGDVAHAIPDSAAKDDFFHDLAYIALAAVPANHQLNTAAAYVSIYLAARQGKGMACMKSAALPTATVLGIALAVGGCAQFGLQTSALSTPLAPSEVDWARKNGTNSVSGTAIMRTNGAIHTCDGQSAILVPDSAYARARMTAIFGNTTRGTRAASLGPVKFERDDPLYVSSLRSTRCDASGSFSFSRVPDGIWYVTSSVKWQGPAQIEGGSMMRRVDLRGGRFAKVTLP